MVRHAVSGTGQKKSSWYQCSCCLRSTAGNIRNIVKSHVLDSKSIQLKDISSDDVSFKTYPLCLPLTLLHVVQMRWLDHFLIQTSPSSQHNSPLLGITSAVYIFPPMLMEIWRGPRLSWSNFQNQYQPPHQKKKLTLQKIQRILMFFEVSEKKHITTVVRGFQFFTIGMHQSQQGKIWPSNPRVPRDPKTRLLRSSHRKFGRIRTKIWSPGENVGLKACLEAVRQRPGSAGWGFSAKTLPPRITDLWSGGSLGNLWGVTWKLQPSSHNLWGCISNEI